MQARRSVIELAVQLLLVILAIALGTSTTTAHAAYFTFDGPTNARAAVHDATAAGLRTAQLDNVLGRRVEAPAQVRGIATTLPSAGNATNAVRYGPHNPGPLVDDVASTFRSGSYTAEVLEQELTLYRVYGGKAGPIGSYWSRTAPSGPMQAQLDSALNPAWGNTATQVSTIRVPAGTTIYDGVAAAQSVPGGGTLLGGGSQVYIPKVDPAWLVP